MPIEFQDLACPKCQQKHFAPLCILKHKAGAGIVEERAGWQCSSCGVRVDVQAMLHAETLRQKRDELRQLERELGVSGEDPHAA